MKEKYAFSIFKAASWDFVFSSRVAPNRQGFQSHTFPCPWSSRGKVPGEAGMYEEVAQWHSANCESTSVRRGLEARCRLGPEFQLLFLRRPVRI